MAKRLRGRFGYPGDDPFVPKLHPARLRDPSEWKNPGRVFVCSMGDLFGDWVDSSWIDKVLEEARHHPGHTFLFLTKNPGRYRDFEFPANCWLGATAVDDRSSYHNSVELAGMNNITFLSYEPLLSPVHTNDGKLRWIDWVIIGAMTGPGAKQYAPKKEWIEDIVCEAKRLNIPIFMKDNLRPSWEGELIQEWP
jgi:protein gp37